MDLYVYINNFCAANNLLHINNVSLLYLYSLNLLNSRHSLPIGILGFNQSIFYASPEAKYTPLGTLNIEYLWIFEFLRDHFHRCKQKLQSCALLQIKFWHAIISKLLRKLTCVMGWQTALSLWKVKTLTHK